MKATIHELPVGTRIKIIRLSDADAWTEQRDLIEGKVFIIHASEDVGNFCVKDGESSGQEYYFLSETEYRKLKSKELV